MVGPNFFSTTGIPIIEGREITERDGGNKQRVGVITETMARKFFPNSEPIGQLAFVYTTAGQAPFVIVGVVQDSKQHSAREKVFPRFYLPYFNPIWRRLDGQSGDSRSQCWRAFLVLIRNSRCGEASGG